MSDRRDTQKDDANGPHIFRKDAVIPPSYKPLGQIFLEKKFVSSEQLDEALKIHWKKGIVFGETMKELGFVSDEQLLEALQMQNEVEARFHT